MAEAKTKSEIVPISRPPEELFRDAYEKQEMIQIATEHINKLREELDVIKEELLFHGIKESEKFLLWESQRVTRKVNAERFATMFPEEYQKLIEEELMKAKRNAGKNIRVQDAERLLGKEVIDPACDLQTSITFVIQPKVIE